MSQLHKLNPAPFDDLAEKWGIDRSATVLHAAGESVGAHKDLDERILIGDEHRREFAERPEVHCVGILRRESRTPEGLEAIVCDECGVSFDRRVIDSGARQQGALRKAGLPASYCGKRFDDSPGSQAARGLLRDWIAGGLDLPCPALFGAPGIGKTHLLIWLSEWMIGTGKVLLYTPVRALLDQVQAEMNEGDWHWQRALAVPYLILDDLGTERETEWRRDRLGRLIEDRYEHERPLIVGTNFRPEVWGDVLGHREASRLRGMTVPIELTGVDRRMAT